MKPSFFHAGMSLLLSFSFFSGYAQSTIDFRESDWVEVKSCTQCEPCGDQVSDKKEVQKNIVFYCAETAMGAWALNKIILTTCDTVQYRTINAQGETTAFANEEQALESICKQAYQLCPRALTSKNMANQGEYSSIILSYLIGEFSGARAAESATEEPASNVSLKKVEVMPRFPGCEHLNISDELKKQCSDRKMLEFIYSKIEYPEIARQNGVEGMVVLSFVIERDGTISEEIIVRDIGAGCGQEALRVVKLMNARKLIWRPGQQDGQSVRVQFNLPIMFKLS